MKPTRATGRIPIDLNDASLVAVGKVMREVDGAVMVGFQAHGQLVLLCPHQARGLATEFDSPEFRKAGLGWIPDQLRHYADVIEAEGATRQ